MPGIGVGLVGGGGHQLTAAEIEVHGARLAGTVDCPDSRGAAPHRDLASLLRDPDVELVSVCQTPRSHQVASAVQALAAGRHVLIERPCATSVAELEQLEDAARWSGTLLCERATTPFEQPYRLARELVAAGTIGQVVQVLVHKSYPYAEWRAQDESVQGGLVLQSAVYGLDCVQLVAGCEIESLQIVDTTLGNPADGALRMAANLVATLRGGGVAGIAANYLNPPDSGVWGRDDLVIFGTEGRLHAEASSRTVEIDRAGGTRVHECPPGRPLLAELLLAIETGQPMVVSPSELMSSTRWALHALRPDPGSATRISWSQGQWWR